MKKADEIISRLNSTGRSELLWQWIRVTGLALSIASGLFVAAILFEAFMHGSVGLRTFVYWLVVGGAALTLGAMMTPTLLKLFGVVKSFTVNSIAKRVGVAYPDVRDTLANVLQLSEETAPTSSNELRNAAFDQAAKIAEPKDFSVIIEKKSGRRALFLAFISLALLLFLPATFPHSLGASLERILRHNESFVPPAPFKLIVSPIADTLMRNTTSQIRVEAVGTPPKALTLWIREGNEERYTSFPIQLDTSDSYTHLLPGLSSSVSFYAEAQWLDQNVSSDTGRIIIIDKPIVRSLSGRVIPPAYTHLSPTELTENNADITALRGSSVDVNIVSTKALRKAQIVIVRGSDSATSDTSVVKMDISGSSAAARFSVTSSGSYFITLLDVDGQQNAEPTKYGIVALTDGYPTISMIEPTKNIDVDASMLVPITVAIADDYGFTSVKLKYKLVSSRYSPPEKNYSEVNISLPNHESAMDVNYVWSLSKIGITPEDVYEFYVEVADNDIITGPKTARTATLQMRLPSLDEVFSDADKAQTEVQKELSELLKESNEIRKEAEELRREMQKQQSQAQKQTDWSDKKKAEDLAKRQEQLEQKMEKAAEKLEEMANKLQQNKAISEETMKKYMELQKLMKEVKSKDLERMQEMMKKAMEKISPEEMERMMKQFTFDEEKFKQNIERTMNLLKRAQAEQKAEELQKRAEELAERQEQLKKEAENTNANDHQKLSELSKQQEKIQEDFKKLAEDAKDLEKLMKEVGKDMPMDQLDAAKKELNEQQTSDQMQSAEQNLEQGDMEKATQNQQNASQNLQRFAQQMNQLKRQMRKNSQKEAMKGMQKGMNDLLQLSKEQEALMQQMKGMDPSSAQYSQLAKKQQQLHESMQNLSNSMMQLGQKSSSVSPEMAQDLGDALQSMKDALGDMQDRNGQMASKEQGGAMSSMNSAVQKMSDALGQMMQGEGQGQGGEGQNPGQGKGQGMSPFQRLQDLAQQQQGINQGMQQMGQNGQPLSQEQRAELGKLAQNQGKALKAMEELEREQREVGGQKKPIGDLKEIAEEMKEVMTDMQTGSITPETKLRQERILSRLLNASRSMNERDNEKTRESRSGVDVSRKSPGALNLDENDAKAMKDILDELKKGYTKDYENLIRRYFEALQKRRIELQEHQ